MATNLSAALNAVNWNNNVESFLAETAMAGELEKGNIRIAVWARQLETTDIGNPALSFVREMQISGHHVAALAALALYKPAAAAMRSMLETALYYTYFRTHLSELATLVRDPRFFVDKNNVLEFHKHHTPGFADYQQHLGLVSRLEQWYGTVSAITHGQIPGAWVDHRALAEIKMSLPTLRIVVSRFTEGEDIVHRLFLCTVGRELWPNFSSHAKKALVSGLPGSVKAALRLDSA